MRSRAPEEGERWCSPNAGSRHTLHMRATESAPCLQTTGKREGRTVTRRYCRSILTMIDLATLLGARVRLRGCTLRLSSWRRLHAILGVRLLGRRFALGRFGFGRLCCCCYIVRLTRRRRGGLLSACLGHLPVEVRIGRRPVACVQLLVVSSSLTVSQGGALEGRPQT